MKTPIPLTLWIPTHHRDPEVYQQLIERYQKLHPQVSVTLVPIPFDSLRPRFIGQANTPQAPDIILYPNDWTGELVEKNLLQTLPPSQVTALPWVQKAFTYNNQLYAFPLSFQVAALIRNQHLVPQAPQNWAELEQTVKRLEQTGHHGFMYDNRDFYYHAAWFHGYGGTLNPTAHGFNISVPPLEASLHFARQLEKNQIIPSQASHSAMLHLFQAGQLGMMISGPWALSTLSSIPFAVSALPLLPEERIPSPFVGAKGWGINTYSSSPDAAKQLAQWLSSLEVQTYLLEQIHELGSHPDIYQDPSQLPPSAWAFFQQAQRATPLPNHPHMKRLWAELNHSLQQTFTTQTPLSELTTLTAKRLQ